MKNTKRIICVLLAAFMMLGLFACKKNEEPGVTPGTESSETPQTPAVVVPDISFYDYTVIRSESASNTLMQEIGDFYALLLARSGKQMMYDVDTLKPGQEPDPAAKEILVGSR